MADVPEAQRRDRDRNEYGRAENQRPRDRTGRPLAYDTDETELAEEWEYDTVEEALETGRALWDVGRFFEAHECLEDVWHHADEGDEDFWQGVIQVAVACVHHQRENPDGAVATFAKARARLADYPDVYKGIDVEELITFCDGAAAAMEDAGSCVEVGYPVLPVTADGPWFRRGSDATPLSREPPWMAAVADDGQGRGETSATATGVDDG